jgi:hypothetical protein
MNNQAAPWARPHFLRSDARAMLLYFVFGSFADPLEVDLSQHDSAGLPRGVEMRRIPKAMLAHWDGHPLRGVLGDILREENRAAFEAARRAPECLMLRGELEDASSLAYLRDTLGVVAALLDAGGVAVVDPQILELLDADAWRARYLEGGAAEMRNHVLIMCQDDDADTAWIKTRGLRKFARPDVSIRRVPQADVERAGALAVQLVELQARGMRFGDGSTIDAEGVPEGLRMNCAGSPDDPEFNNTHLALRWPAA